MRFTDLSPSNDSYSSEVVDRILRAAVQSGASDIHLTQQRDCVSLRWRINGKLQDLGNLPDGTSTSILGRVKALARLITYRSDIPQEGRLQLQDASETSSIEARVGTLPTIHGERAVIRLSLATTQDWLLNDLGLQDSISTALRSALSATSGVILISGPAGSGKTTSAYACLREILASGELRSMVSLEDPVESEIEGVAQSQIHSTSGYDWASGLKALLRQDPEVMLVGEIRDPETAAIVFQAAMTGQLVITTMHARSAADAVRRLLDMSVPVHHLRSALDVLTCQRLYAVPCPCLQTDSPRNECEQCHGSGTSGRKLIAELLPAIEGDLAKAIVQDAETSSLQAAAEALGMCNLATLTAQAERSGEVFPGQAPQSNSRFKIE